MFIYQVMFDAGIVPMTDVTHDMRRPLESIPEDEARKMKRRFRKLWRKASKREVELNDDKRKSIGLEAQGFLKKQQKSQPSRVEKLRRKQAVSKMFWEQHITPMLARFKNLEDTRKKDQAAGEVGP